MQENRQITVGISPTPEILNPKCSCTECDSVSCFAKRQADVPCACEVCKSSCCIYDSDLNLSKSKADFKDFERELAQENVTSELIKSQITYELDKNNHIKVTSKTQSRSSYKTVGSKDKIEKSGSDSLTRVSALIANRHKEVGPSTAKLSAQVMDLPYKDFRNSISKPNFPTTLSNLSPFDIFSRIKEAYKACSCKVCECIVGKSLRNDLCKCKPCECNDCASFNRRVKSFTNGEVPVPRDDESCPCIRCERGSCKGIGKGKTRQQECDCVGVLQCSNLLNDNFSRACDCEPCQCIECAPRSIHRHRALIVAPVGEEYQHRNVCQCSPCECFECGRGFRLSSNQHNEVSTSMNRHPQCLCESCTNEACIPDGTQSCRCERQSKVMSKPFQKDSNDYDIRRTTVTYDDAQKYKEASNYDTIAMFAAVTHSYPNLGASKKQCDCDQCECLVCKNRKITDSTCLSKVFEPIQNYHLKLENKSSRDFTFFDKQDSKLPNLKIANVCGCDVCECITCHGLASSKLGSNKYETKKSKSKFSAKSDCRCNPCDCADCEKLMTSCVGDICLCSNCKCENCINENNSDEVIYPVKRGEQLTPSLFRRKIKDAFIESCINTLEANQEILKQPVSFESSKNKPSGFSSVQHNKTLEGRDASYRQYLQERYFSNFSTRSETVKHAQIKKCVNNPNLYHRNEPSLESNLSAYSSMSFLKESGSITHSRHKLRSWESSCNSSGHDYPNYLIHFPKTTVETCLNDVMQLNSDTNNNIKLTQTTTLSSKNNVRNQYNKDLNINFRIPPPKCLPMRTITQEDLAAMNAPLTKKDRKLSKYIEENLERQNVNFSFKPEKHLSTDKESISITKKNNLSSFAMSQDYERVQNTLQEARAFSLHLIRLLQKYEKANREFESVSKTINKSIDSLSNKTNAKSKDHDEDLNISFDMDEVPTKEQQQGSSGSSTEELVIINKNANKVNEAMLLNAQSYENKSIVNNYENQSEPCSENNEGRDESGDDIIKKPVETLNTITEEKEPVDVSQKQNKNKKVISKFHRRYSKMYKRSIICSKRIKSSTNRSNIEVDATIAVDTNETPILGSEQTLKIDKRNDIDNEKIKKDFDIAIKPPLPENVNLPKQVKKSTTELKVSVTERYTKDQHISQKDVVVIKQPMVEHFRHIIEMKGEKPWPILKKNFCLSTNTNTLTHERKLFAPLEKDIKAAAQIISKQPTDENATYLYENKALIKLHSEVKKLLDMPILQTVENTFKIQRDNEDTFNHLSKTSSSQTNQGSEDISNTQKNARVAAVDSGKVCEPMKVNFLTARRVSDHTVLVKWNTPRLLDNVLGYELLVDGRPVQKFFSPSRRMAVVTCLPQNDKVLLTVRTVVNSPCPDHCSAATVIYQPKIT